MEKYKNLSGKSGIDEYHISDTAIKIKFINSPVLYIYSYRRPGQQYVDKMKQLAISGSGLATYISQNIKKNYDYKE